MPGDVRGELQLGERLHVVLVGEAALRAGDAARRTPITAAAASPAAAPRPPSRTSRCSSLTLLRGCVSRCHAVSIPGVIRRRSRSRRARPRGSRARRCSVPRPTRARSRPRSMSFSPLTSSSTSSRGEPAGERPRVGAGVVHAVREQDDPGIPRRHTGELLRGELERERHVGEPLRRDPQHRVEQLHGLHRLAERSAGSRRPTRTRSPRGRRAAARRRARRPSPRPSATRSPFIDPDTSTASTTDRVVRMRSRTMMSSSSGTGCSASTSIVRSRSISSEPPRYGRLAEFADAAPARSRRAAAGASRGAPRSAGREHGRRGRSWSSVGNDDGCPLVGEPRRRAPGGGFAAPPLARADAQQHRRRPLPRSHRTPSAPPRVFRRAPQRAPASRRGGRRARAAAGSPPRPPFSPAPPPRARG